MAREVDDPPAFRDECIERQEGPTNVRLGLVRIDDNHLERPLGQQVSGRVQGWDRRATPREPLREGERPRSTRPGEHRQRAGMAEARAMAHLHVGRCGQRWGPGTATSMMRG